MKIAILSDVHLGFGRGSEREGDAYAALAEVLEKSRDADFILLAGDLFDSNAPQAETLALAEEIMLPYLLSESSIKVSEGLGKDVGKLKLVNPQGRPIIAIHGTHERRAKGLLNPIQALERAGFLIHLHVNGIVLEKDGEKVCIQGMSGVPEQYSDSVLQEWDPKPRNGCYNILVIHQNLKGFMHEKVPHQLDPERLNRGFNLYVCGHVHDKQEAVLGDGRLVVPGSLVVTQLTSDAEKPLGFYEVDTRSSEAVFQRLESQRPVHFVEGKDREELEREIGKALEGKTIKPILRIKVPGDVQIKDIRERFSGKAILSFKRESEEKEEAGAVSLEEQRLSVRELGRKLLRENLERQGLKPEVFEGVFELLLEKRHEKALELLRGGRPEVQEVPRERKKRVKKEEQEKWKDKGELGRFLG